ncbi:hypothetical protein BJ508DRAFT_227165 [Ascobolus immersus RN42]|uniref:Uncharacterized protein n=1 Tax=Ascobolus immersus RN42 TaxID=1160509 RepID=A0A3N4I1B6_ASCIM|nr:hypothetical protein BJ508DRAFT_227165 [Ascobolus immersus RN42]
MPSTFLLFLTIATTVLSYLLSLVSTQTLQALIWQLATLIPGSSAAKQQATHRKLQREVLTLRGQLRATSSQDEFAKWAKLKRKEDKLLADFEKSKKALESHKSTHSTLASTSKRILTTGVKLVLQFYYLRTPVFHLPKGAVPGYIEWVLAFPKCPSGSVSVNVWMMAVGAVVELLGAAVAWVWASTVGREKVAPLEAKVEGEGEKEKAGKKDL